MSTRPNRETAYRVFAAEFEDASLSYAASDDERAPNYVVTPTGARINRLFAVGVLTEIESVNAEQLRARIVDPTGAFVVYAGQYQPEALSFLERAETPAFVAVTGKARTFQPEDSNRVFTSIRPETLSEVDATTRDRFTVDAAERTTERVQVMQEALERDERDDALREALEAEGVEAGLMDGIPRAIDHYGTTRAYLDALGEMALDAARTVAGEREEVGSLDVAPDEGGSTDTELVDADATESTASVSESTDETEPAAETTPDEVVGRADSEGGVESESTSGSEASAIGTEAESAHETDESTVPESMTEPEQPDTGIEDEGASDSFEGTDEPSEVSESEVSDGEIGDTSVETEEDFGDPEEFELDDEVREQIEDTYGTDFESAAEVGEPGEAGIETSTPEEASTDSSEEPDSADRGTEADEFGEETEPTTREVSSVETTETAETREDDTAEDPEPAELADEASDDEADADIDPEGAVVTAMRELDDGSGADREAVIESVIEDHGLTREDAEEGIQEALMSGECYEPDDDTLKPI